METSVLDLKHKTADVLKALNRNEAVRLTYRGRLKGIIQPAEENATKKLRDHPFFKLKKGEKGTVLAKMDRLRGGRYRDL